MRDPSDFLDEDELQINDNVLKSISGVVSTYDKLSAELGPLEARVREVKKLLLDIERRELPELMDAAGTSSFTDKETGRTVEISLLVAGTLPKEPVKRAEALKYMESIGGSSLIKTDVVVEFDKGDAEKSKLAIELLETAGFKPYIEAGIHPQTLAAFARERIRSGLEIDGDVVGLFIASVATVKEPKLKAEKKPKTKNALNGA